MNKTLARAALAAFGLMLTWAAMAASDPMIGAWKAPPNKEDAAEGLGATTMTITSVPGGYATASVAHGKHGDMKTTVPIIPDGKPHAGMTTFGPVTATCHHGGVRTLTCEVHMGPMPPTQSTFTLSADGKTLTETDVTPAPGSSSQGAGSAADTEVTVYHKQ